MPEIHEDSRSGYLGHSDSWEICYGEYSPRIHKDTFVFWAHIDILRIFTKAIGLVRLIHQDSSDIHK